MAEMVLSLFPGIGLLDLAFERAGCCIVRGPDILWGGDVRRFHPPPERFAGVIGGPPCQAFSSLAPIVRARHGEAAVKPNLIPQYERVVSEAAPEWFLMENVRGAPLPHVENYAVSSCLLNARSFGCEQNRVRRFSFGVRSNTPIPLLRYIQGIHAIEAHRIEYAVHSGGTGMLFDRGGVKRHQATMERRDAKNHRTLQEMLVLQGLPENWLSDCPLTATGKRQAVANGVPLPMGEAIARAVLLAVTENPHVSLLPS